MSPTTPGCDSRQQQCRLPTDRLRSSFYFCRCRRAQPLHLFIPVLNPRAGLVRAKSAHGISRHKAPQCAPRGSYGLAWLSCPHAISFHRFEKYMLRVVRLSVCSSPTPPRPLDWVCLDSVSPMALFICAYIYLFIYPHSVEVYWRHDERQDGIWIPVLSDHHSCPLSFLFLCLVVLKILVGKCYT